MPKQKKVTETTTTVTTTTTTTTTAPKLVVDFFLLDESGSMGSVRSTTISSVNEYITMAKNDAAKYGMDSTISILKFDNELRWICQNVDINSVAPLTNETYSPRGGTALNDATGTAINHLKTLLAGREKSDNVDVTLTIFTDGYENASKEFPGIGNAALTALVKDVQTNFGWTIAYAGAGPREEVVRAAQNLGVIASNTLSYDAGVAGTTTAFASLGVARSMKSMNYSKGIKSNTGYVTNEKKEETTTT